LHCYVLNGGFRDGKAGYEFAMRRFLYYRMIAAASRGRACSGAGAGSETAPSYLACWAPERRLLVRGAPRIALVFPAAPGSAKRRPARTGKAETDNNGRSGLRPETAA